jgi:membrane fusion protein (multidrug efflux system)
MFLPATLVVIGLLGQWGYYRYGHVVCHDSFVKGFVPQVGARIDGQVVRLEVEAGQAVRKGDVLARLEDSHLQAAAAQARAELQRALRDLEAGQLALDQSRRELTAQVDHAKAEFELASAQLEREESLWTLSQKEYTRMLQLVQRRANSLSDLDKASAEQEAASSAVTAAQARKRAAAAMAQAAHLALEGLRVQAARLQVQDAQVELARSALRVAEAELDATVIRAPEDGWVVRRIMEPGASVKVGQPILALWIGGRLWVEAWIDETDLGKIRVGSQATVKLDAYPSTLLPGHVESIGALTDTELQGAVVSPTLHSFYRPTPKVPVRIVLDHPDARLRPGLSAVVSIPKTGN